MNYIHLAQLQLLLATPYFAAYVANLRSFVAKHADATCSYDDLIDAFVWDETPEGHRFWSAISDDLVTKQDPTSQSILDYIDANYSPTTHPHLYI